MLPPLGQPPTDHGSAANGSRASPELALDRFPPQAVSFTAVHPKTARGRLLGGNPPKQAWAEARTSALAPGRNNQWPRDVAKRTVDVSVAAFLLAVTSPVQAVVAVLVARKLGRPVLFEQTRPGRGGVPFKLRKFRTMLPPDPSRGLVSDADRLTRFGRILRETSLDELPELWNVLRGDMSLVGPRPLLMEYLDRYTPEQARRHSVRPGITGLAQVRGRNAISWEDRLALDVAYVDNHSLCQDARILALTVLKVFRREGISHGSHVTMPEFGVPDGP